LALANGSSLLLVDLLLPLVFVFDTAALRSFNGGERVLPAYSP